MLTNEERQELLRLTAYRAGGSTIAELDRVGALVRKLLDSLEVGMSCTQSADNCDDPAVKAVRWLIEEQCLPSDLCESEVLASELLIRTAYASFIAATDAAIASLKAENERLRWIVDRLDKTDDGVPLVPGDHCFCVAKSHYDDDECPDIRVLECKYMDPTDPETECWPFECIEAGNMWEVFTVLSKWSTRSAAENAANGEKKP